MGITRSNLHKRRATGGRRKIHRKKRKFELGRQPANTKLGRTKIKLVRVRGGNYKVRGLRLNSGNYAWGSEGIAHKTRILDVVYNASNNELVRTKTIVKGAIVLVDATPFRQFYENRYAESLGKKKEDLLEKASENRKKKIDERRTKRNELDELLRDQFPTGKLMARIASRPGQVGRSDGYILEGPELAFYLRKVQQKKSKK
ncbi:ribosomal protein S8 [Acrasis kona]|uniref:40S ribosomal protein S8 n=1 Tax=Acrasis kona TaxID=1008807 RepID=A0AAW2ZGV5_9EUKA